ncbi:MULTISPECIES: aldehyde dehydrogenase family protein [Bartonella]|uniref:aldehyde dehydrogenase family protein n=1 Tax=Bartonella TaxID=773 RepID=UPI0018DBBB38|nr:MULTISPECIES: aldehyde dehydrogenase family protein [Bartonella]MBH9995852.1 aldehyde dehydrogenase family protein [Bartonella sp. P0291]MBH9998013.1 aldehyde dehydrogenase family protein [Bartonella sp. M0192]MBI0000121.1 aldehyde dehydrogenase family protein [Bartonella sp. M0191]MBI0008713.1 aldehyde dehydrogenase family protein [Bartonella sp. M0193]MBI0011412.1 aldehyde dehydrogenase family protein [Bartonella sp. M0176]
MLEKRKFYINGAWVEPAEAHDLEVIDPSTEEVCGVISNGTSKDVDRAVAAAKAAFDGWKHTDPQKRLTFVEKILAIYNQRQGEMAKAISTEMGAPIDMAIEQQVGAGARHIETFIDSFLHFSFQTDLVKGHKDSALQYEPVGVVGLITPWNWPMNQITLKVIPAMLAGCTMVLKPSEIAPLSALLFADIIDQAGVPKGVFNLVNGDGAGVGTCLSGHPDIAMISFTGSTRAGKAISKNAADTLKRVGLELGGKGANLVFADAREDAVKWSVLRCFNNSGQSCNAPTRMFVERSIYEKAKATAKEVANNVKLAVASQHGNHLGPVVSKAQFDKIEGLIQSGIDEGATLIAGGTGLPEGINHGYFVRPTVFADVKPNMRIFREEIFGPVLSMIPFDTEEEALAMASDTDYGLTNYVQSEDREKCHRIATALRSGMVEVNGLSLPKGSYFGGVKYSGHAREGGIWGIKEFLDTKAISEW